MKLVEMRQVDIVIFEQITQSRNCRNRTFFLQQLSAFSAKHSKVFTPMPKDNLPNVIYWTLSVFETYVTYCERWSTRLDIFLRNESKSKIIDRSFPELFFSSIICNNRSVNTWRYFSTNDYDVIAIRTFYLFLQ